MKKNPFLQVGLLLVAGGIVGLSGGSVARANYFNGFESSGSTSTDFSGPGPGFVPSSNNYTPGADISRVQSGGGSLGLTAASGNYYAEITNVPTHTNRAMASQSLPPSVDTSRTTLAALPSRWIFM